MPFQIKTSVRGLEQIALILSKAGETYRTRIARILHDRMTNAVNEARAIAGSRGWALANQIYITQTSDFAVVGGCYAAYAGFPEFGTLHQPAQPFWRPAVWKQFFLLRDELYQVLGEMYA